MSTKRKFRELYQFEYSSPQELLLRFVIITSATLLFTVETGWLIGLLWVALYYGTHFLNWIYFQLRWHDPQPFDMTVVSGLFLALIMLFAWLPGYLILQTDYLSMQIVGGAAIGGLLLWLIKRSDKSIGLMWGEVITIGVCMAILLAFAMPMIGSLYEQVAVSIAGTGLVIYFGIALFLVRKHRIQAEEAIKKSAETQKLEAIGHLASGVAHDFNNILTAAIGNLELYKELSNPREREQCIEESLLAARRGEALVRKLLSYGRRASEHDSQVVLANMIESLRSLGRRLVPAPVHMVFRVPEPNIVLNVSEEELTTALLNLMVNARDAMPEGGHLHVDVTPLEVTRAKLMLDGAPLAPGHYLRFDVSDTGPGMPPEVLRRVLEPFFTTKPDGAGSGLGLPLVAEFARSSGGGLTIVTSPKGTRVSFYLPYDTRDLLLEASAA